MSINWQEILFHFLGGLGLFLYSIKTMGDGLQQAAGDRLRFYIDKYTSNPFLGVLVGIVVTPSFSQVQGLQLSRLGWSALVFSLLDRLSELSWGPTSEPLLLPLSSVSSLVSMLYP